jgi:anti-anti-sigma factor
MPEPPATFAIHESQIGLFVRLSLTGELDLGSAPVLEDRLTRLRAVKSPVRLDLSQLEFIDSTGLHLLVRTVGDAQIKGWELEIERDVAPEVMRLFKLVHLDRFVLGPRTAGGRDPRSAKPPQ